MNELLRFVKKLCLFLCVFVFIDCSESDSSDNYDSFDHDGIALVNNGEDTDFSGHENVWQMGGLIDSNGLWIDSNIEGGIVNKKWGLNSENTVRYKIFATETRNEFSQYAHGLTPPYYAYYANGEYYAGSFRLYKNDGNFCVTTVINKKRSGTQWNPVTEQKETHTYLVDTFFLMFDKN